MYVKIQAYTKIWFLKLLLEVLQVGKNKIFEN